MADPHVFRRDMAREYPLLVRGEGAYVWDDAGRRYLDATSGISVSCIGHGRERVAEALRRQALTLAYATSGYFANAPAEALAERISRLTPGDLNSVFFTTGGSEAVETALKLARRYHLERGRLNKHLVIGRWASYHGATAAALAAGGHTPRRRPYTPYLLPFPHIAPAYCYRCPFGQSHPSCGVACADDLERAILRAGAENVSAFIAEPIVGAAAGALVPPPDYFVRIREICDRHDVLFIADEVITGFGRTGRYFALEYWNVVPDMMTVAKGMSGGYAPLGAVIVSERIREICDRHDVLFIADEVITGFGRTGRYFALEHWNVVPDMMTVAKGMSGGYAPLGAVIVSDGIRETFQQNMAAFAHGFTYSDHPLSCAAALEVLDIIAEEDLVAAAAQQGDYLLEALKALRRHRIVGDVRGRGLLAGIELVRDRETKEPFPAERHAADRLLSLCLQRGLIIYPGGGMVDGARGDQFLLCPPYIITHAQIDDLVAALDAALLALQEEMDAAWRS